MKNMLVEEDERRLALVLNDGWILKSCIKGLLFQCGKGILDINQTIIGVVQQVKV